MITMSFQEKNKIRIIKFAIVSITFLATFFVVQSANAVYSVAGHGKFRLKGFLFTFFILLAGFTFASPAYGAPVFYSVGQNTDDHKTGTPTVTISGTTATFSVAQTATNMGVGDVITYVGGTCYISGKTSTTVWSCINATGGNPFAVTNANVASIMHVFSSLNAAIAGSSTLLGTSNLVSGDYQLNIPCYYDSGGDTTQVFVQNYTTGPNNYIKIYTPSNVVSEANQIQRHNGKSGNNFKMLNAGQFRIYTDYTRIDGIEFSQNTAEFGIMTPAAGGSAATDIRISNCLLYGFSSAIYGLYNVKLFLWNNIIYDSLDVSIDLDAGIFYLYNNTIIGGTRGINAPTATQYLYNNIANGQSQAGFNVGGTVTSGNNISQDTTSPNAAFRNKTVSFVDATNKDFHLSPTDTAAKNAGVDLSADVNLQFLTDIDGQTRFAPWDIGADQSPKSVYYSVGQSASDLKTGTPVLTIAAGTGTFSVAQTGNIGVGDRVTYNTNQIAYISAKTDPDSAHWSLVTATGGIPADISNSAVVSITREFTSLSAAVTAASNAQHVNNTDLVAANVVLNFPCYYDSGADTNSVTVDGYTTGASNYIRIYTPSGTATEANNSQRHTGKWDAAKYNLVTVASADYESSLNVNDNFVRIEGLQVSVANNDNSNLAGIRTFDLSAGSEIYVSGNIVKGIYASTNDDVLYGIDNWSSVDTFYVYNNLVYDINSTHWISSGILLRGGDAYVYNNTIVNSTRGIVGVGGNQVAKNNLVQGVTGGSVYSVSALSDYNITDRVEALDGAHSKSNTTVSFVDAASKNFHLAPTDTGARNAGTDLQHDSNLAFDRDIDGQARAGFWDIGADQVFDTQIQSPHAESGISNGLVGHWTFDAKDVNGTTAVDTSGNNNNGTISGATRTIGKLGQALSFNGTSSNVSVGNANQSVSSISFWVKPVSTSQYAIDLDGGSHYVRVNAGVVTAVGFASPTIYVDGIAATTFPDTSWHFVTITTASAITASNLTIGKVSSNYFSGTLDDIRLYNRVLSLIEINILAHLGIDTVAAPEASKGNTNDLVGYWSFDGPTISGAAVSDLSGNNNNGTISGAILEQGKVGQGMKFDGVDDYVGITQLTGLPIYNRVNYSISMWVKGLPNQGDKRFFTESNSGGGAVLFGLGVFFASSKLDMFIRDDLNVAQLSHVQSQSTVFDNTWHHIVWTDNNGTAILYVDGIQDATNFNYARSTLTPNTTSIGNLNRGGNTSNFNGFIDEVRLYDHVLGQQEVLQLFNGGKVQIKK